MFILVNGKPAQFKVRMETWLDGDIEAESLNNQSMIITYDSPSAHFERVCRNEDMRKTIDEIVELALDSVLV